jgi:DNA-binding XRE family transcriptional regulator
MKQMGLKKFKNNSYVSMVNTLLNLTAEEATYIEIRLDISNLIKSQRQKRNWTQQQLAAVMGSSQSRIAKIETGNPGTSLDLMIKALLQLGISKKDIGKLLEGKLEPA